jgi:hypothetical protein
VIRSKPVPAAAFIGPARSAIERHGEATARHGSPIKDHD